MKNRIISVFLILVLSLSFSNLYSLINIARADDKLELGIEIVYQENGHQVDEAIINIEYARVGETQQEIWEELAKIKYEAEKIKYTIDKNLAKSKLRIRLSKLPLGYKTEQEVYFIKAPQVLSIKVVRDVENVNNKAKNARFNIKVHTVPPLQHAKFYIEEIKKFDSLASSRANGGFVPSNDLGGIFASGVKKKI